MSNINTLWYRAQNELNYYMYLLTNNTAYR